MTFDELPTSWQKRIRDLRSENAKLRIRRNELDQQVAELSTALDALGT
ncbi:hypothetical protein BH11ACT6_BH11ACT6_01710 [soil metagenome]